MRTFWIAVLALAIPVVIYGQLDDKTLTVASTWIANPQPDLVTFNVNVTAGLAVGLNEVLAALAGTGVSASDLSYVYAPYGTSEATTEWSFGLTAPLTKLSQTLSSLSKTQQAMDQNNTGMALDFSITGVSRSSGLQVSQSCPPDTMIGDARARAEKIATAAGVGLGPIVAMSDGSVIGQQSSFVVRGPGVPGSGPFPEIVSISDLNVNFTCYLMVQFKLTP